MTPRTACSALCRKLLLLRSNLFMKKQCALPENLCASITVGSACGAASTSARARAQKIVRSESHLVQQGGAQGAVQGWGQIGVGVVKSAGLVSRGSWLCAEVVCGQQSRSKARSVLASLRAGAPQKGSAPQCSDPMERFSGSFFSVSRDTTCDV